MVLIMSFGQVLSQFDYDFFNDVGGGLPIKRHYGQPNPYANSNDRFDKELTPEEIESARINPLPHVFNPLIRKGVTGLQQIEARYHQKPYPQRLLLRPILDFHTNPSKK